MDQLRKILQNFDKWGITLPPMGGGATAFQTDVQLLAPTTTFDEGDDGNHTGVVVEPGSAWLIRLVVGDTWTGTTPLLDVGIDFNDDGIAGTWRRAINFAQVAEADAETNGQVVYYAAAVCAYTAAGATTCGMRAVTDVQGTTPIIGTVSIEAMGIDFPGNFPFGVIGYNPQILPTRRLQ